jgi:hypothetical protein
MDTTKQTAEAERATGTANADLNHKPGPREHKLYIVIFGLLGLILLPVTGLWALFAYLAGDKYPLYALRGENVDDDLIDNP